MHKGKKSETMIWGFLLCVCIGVFTFSIWSLIGMKQEKNRIQKEYKDLSEIAHSNVCEESAKIMETTGTTESVNHEPKQKINKLEELETINKDIIGWLTIKGTTIDYPIVQRSEEQEFYLSHDFYQKKERHGTPFLDKDCTPNGKCNLLIYGHHMKDGTMFAPLKKYEKKEYFVEHNEIIFSTKKIDKKFKIVAVCKVNANTDAELFSYLSNNLTEKEYEKVKSIVEQKQLYSCEEEISIGDALLTLSTCDYSEEEGRIIVLAKEIPT